MGFFSNMDDLALDRSHPVDLYQQVADRIAEGIRSGALPPGDKLPGERDLTRVFDVSMTTIRKALGELTKRGLLIRNAPRGTFVASPEIHQEKHGEKRWVHALFAGWDVFSDVLTGAGGELLRHGYHVVGSDISQLTAKQAGEFIAALSPDQVAGLLVYPFLSVQWRDCCRELPKTGFPLVFIDDDLRMRVPTVHMDNHLGIRLAVRHLVGLGHRDLGYIGEQTPSGCHSLAREQRRESFLKTCRDLGVRVRQENVFSCSVCHARGIPRPGWEPELRAYLAGKKRPTGVVCFNDTIAASLWQAAESAGIRVPEELSITGFDDVLFDRCREYALTTLNVQEREIGVLAARKLAMLIEGEASQKDRCTLVPPRLVVRRSTAPPQDEGARHRRLAAALADSD